MSQQTIYYEHEAGQYLLCIAGVISAFPTFDELRVFVHESYPDSLLELVTDDNWQDIYDAGGFFL